jgi:hypothetical protein
MIVCRQESRDTFAVDTLFTDSSINENENQIETTPVVKTKPQSYRSDKVF